MSASKHRDYFLGSLDEAASAEIELRVLDDIDFTAELALAEEDLIEDFLDNSLSSEEVGLFRTNYLNTEERVKNVEMTALIRRLARENLNNNALEIGDSDSREDSGIFHWFASLGLGVRLAAASVALVVVITSVWLVSRSQRDSELIALQKRYEQINQAPASIPLDTNSTELALVGGNLRASGSTAELSRNDLTETVRFRIALPPQTDSSTGYAVTVFRDTTEVFRQNNIRPLANSTTPELRLLLPGQIFTAGNYRISLKTTQGSELHYYLFVR